MREAVAFKVLTGAELAELETGSFAGSADDRRDGFIHLSTCDQLTGTVDKHFAGREDLGVEPDQSRGEERLLAWTSYSSLDVVAARNQQGPSSAATEQGLRGREVRSGGGGGGGGDGLKAV